MIGELLAGIGLLFSLVGVLGVLRLPDFMNRLHATTMIATAGTGLAMLGLCAYAAESGEWGFAKGAAVIAAAVMLGAAMGSHSLARACFRSGTVPENLEVNETHFKEARKGKGAKDD
jgi:monovalent cation/proton antiporter MnhG/PhaG subunit